MSDGDGTWDQAVARLRRQTGVTSALGCAALLLVLREEWGAHVVARTVGPELLFTRVGEDYPFGLDVRVGLVGRAYAVRLVSPAGVQDATQVGADDVDQVVAAYLARLVGDRPGSADPGTGQ